MGSSKPSVFVREATGLVKSVGPWTLMFANLGEIGFGTGLLLLNVADSFFPNGNPGGNVVFATLFFFVFALFEAYIYYRIVRDVGRVAGDYVWISRKLGPVVGGLLLYGFVFTGIPFIALEMNWFVTLSLAPSLSTVALVTGSSGLASFVSALTTPGFLAVFSLVSIGLLTAVNILSPRLSYTLLSVLAALALLGTLLMVIPYLALGPQGVKSSVDAFLSGYGSGYAKVASGYTGPFVTFGGVLLLLPYLAYSLPWINNAAAFSGEVKDKRKAALTGTFVPLTVSSLLLVAFSAVYYGYLGFGFTMSAPINWPSSLSSVGASPNMLTVATILLRNYPALALATNILFSVWYLAAAQQTILSISRYVLGLSFDRLLPARFSAVSERFHSPVASLLLTFVISAPLVAIADYENWFSLFSTSALGMVFFAFVGITAIAYAASGKKNIPLMVAGAVTLVFYFALAYMYVGLPYYGINDLSWGIMILFWLLGAIAYPLSRAYHSRKGIDVSLAFREIPPE